MQPCYPCDLEEALRGARPGLELHWAGIAGLSVGRVNRYLREQAVGLPLIDGPSRALSGCLLAERGRGYLLYDAVAEGCEQRWTKALLLARFLEAHHRPRVRALELLGEPIRPVLDGVRPATRAEQIHAVMSSIRLENLDVLIAYPHEPPTSSAGLETERRIERIALELLAPAALLRQRLCGFQPRVGGLSRHDWLARLLCDAFGLPAMVARNRAHNVIGDQGDTTLLDWLQANINR
ncbi:MAG: hypothetical protein OHK0022_23970 [Roseiflexaceae bacterium]